MPEYYEIKIRGHLDQCRKDGFRIINCWAACRFLERTRKENMPL